MAAISVANRRTPRSPYLSTKVIRQTSVRVEDTQVGATDIAHPELLMPTRARGLGQLLELLLLLDLLSLERLALDELCHRLVHLALGSCDM